MSIAPEDDDKNIQSREHRFEWKIPDTRKFLVDLQFAGHMKSPSFDFEGRTFRFDFMSSSAKHKKSNITLSKPISLFLVLEKGEECRFVRFHPLFTWLGTKPSEDNTRRKHNKHIKDVIWTKLRQGRAREHLSTQHIKKLKVSLTLTIDFLICIGESKFGSENLKEEWRKLVDNPNSFPDVSFEVKNEKTVQAHRGILAQRSEPFKAMFTHEMAEKKDGKVDWKMYDKEAVVQFFNILYTGDLKWCEAFKPTLPLLEQLLELSNMHLNAKMSNWCAHEIEQMILTSKSVEDVTKVVAKFDNIPSIQKAGEKWIQEHTRQIAKHLFSSGSKRPNLDSEEEKNGENKRVKSGIEIVSLDD